MIDTAMTEHLFSPITIRDVTLPHRIIVSPMCQYSSDDGFANDWHLVHLGSRAVSGAALVLTEATAVSPEGRISPRDLGLWKDEQAGMLARIVRFIESQGSVAGIQLAHAGRKASTAPPWDGGGVVAAGDGGWTPVAPSAVAFREGDPLPIAITEAGIDGVVHAFAAAAKRSLDAGFRVLEIHGAHGYLIHEFLSPLSNHRDDQWGGSFDNRIRLVLEVIRAVRTVWPSSLPLFLRISATDWVDGGWDLEQSIELARRVAPLGVDLVDCSSGGLVPTAKIPAGSGFQVPFAAAIRREAGVKTGAVGLITAPGQADQVVRNGEADVVLLARQFLREPTFPQRAARDLGAEIVWPNQYLRAK